MFGGRTSGKGGVLQGAVKGHRRLAGNRFQRLLARCRWRIQTPSPSTPIPSPCGGNGVPLGADRGGIVLGVTGSGVMGSLGRSSYAENVGGIDRVRSVNSIFILGG